MKKCTNCGINIIDNTNHCPLCRCVVKEDKTAENIFKGIGGYPDAVALTKRYRFIGNLILFLSICASLICLMLNIYLANEIAWSVLVILSLIYGNIIVHYAILGQSGYRQKAIIIALIGIGVVIGIDAITGYKAWSVNFVFPGAIILLDIGIIVLMIVNRRNWQSYMMTQILMVILSIAGLILEALDIITWPYLMQGAMAGSLLLFIGTLILGDRRARVEMKRRFHF